MFRGFPKEWHTDMKNVYSKYPRSKHVDGINKFVYPLNATQENKAHELLKKCGFKLEKGFYLTEK